MSEQMAQAIHLLFLLIYCFLFAASWFHDCSMRIWLLVVYPPPCPLSAFCYISALLISYTTSHSPSTLPAIINTTTTLLPTQCNRRFRRCGFNFPP